MTPKEIVKIAGATVGNSLAVIRCAETGHEWIIEIVPPVHDCRCRLGFFHVDPITGAYSPMFAWYPSQISEIRPFEGDSSCMEYAGYDSEEE